MLFYRAPFLFSIKQLCIAAGRAFLLTPCRLTSVSGHEIALNFPISRSKRSSSVVVDDGPQGGYRVDALGVAHIRSTDSLTAICLLTIA